MLTGSLEVRRFKLVFSMAVKDTVCFERPPPSVAHGLPVASVVLLTSILSGTLLLADGRNSVEGLM